MRARLAVGRRALAAWALALAACATPAPPPPAADAPVRVTLLQINDVYELEPVDEGRRGGFARLATLLRRVRAERSRTLFVLAGDTLSPSVASASFLGAHMIAGLNALGLDAATFGNHEFDFGPDVLRERMRESRFVWLSANVLERGDRRPFGGARATHVADLAGVAVGLFGLTTPETAGTSNAGAEVLFEDPVEAARAASQALRREGARLVVGVTHLHMREDRALAAAPGVDVDVILGGHEHEPLVAEEGRTLITKAGSDARYLVQVDVWLEPRGGVLDRSWAFHEVSRRLPEDPEVAALVRAYAARLARALDVEIGRTAVPLEARRARVRTEETNLGDFVADAMRARMRTDVALVNGGGLRTDRVLPPGPLTRRDVQGLLPFGNVVLALEMSGGDLRRALEHGLGQVEREGGGFLQVSGLRVVFDRRRPAGARVVAVEVGGRPLDRDARYTVAVANYLVKGGDGHTAFRGGRVLVGEESGPLLAALVAEAISRAGTIAPGVDGRLRAVGD
jgi:5'-nucleotidase